MRGASLLPILLSVRCTRGDLPVHCLRHQLVGDWVFSLSPTSAVRQSCGHERPDNEGRQPPVSLAQVDRTLDVRLSDPDRAVTPNDPDGRWTMIYDEAFEVNVEGLSLLAFSRFDYSAGKNASRCGETQVGWFRNRERTRWGCYLGQKREGLLGLLSLVPGRAAKALSYDEPLDSDYHSTFAGMLNSLQDTWTAKAHEWFSGKTLRELNSMAGLYRSHPPRLDSTAPSFLQTRQRNPFRVAALPKSWDWRNVSGVNYLDSVMDQGECGSCYMVSTIHMLSARHRIKQRDPTLEPFSITFPLFCSEYNQGCNGGYAFLATKWAHDVGLVPRSCLDYRDSGSCQLQCDVAGLGRRWRADNYHYVGGYYGGSTEEGIMRELVHGGPLVASFEPKNDIMYYGGGVYKRVPNQRSEWEQVDHAVLLVGFGEDAGEKYWTLQNSWGDTWGEDGFFRVVRGTDESGIESIVVAADVVEDDQPVVLDQFAALL